MQPPRIQPGTMNYSKSAPPLPAVQVAGKSWERVAHQLTESLHDVTRHAKICFHPGGELVNNLRIVPDSRHADVIPGAGLTTGFRCRAPVRSPQGDAARTPVRQFSGGADRIEGKSQFVGKNICRAAGQDAEGNPARCKAIDHFVDGPIAATNQYDVNAVRGRLVGQFVRHCGPRRGRQLDLHPRTAQNVSGCADFALPLGRTPPRNRIINERTFFQLGASGCGRGLTLASRRNPVKFLSS